MSTNVPRDRDPQNEPSGDRTQPPAATPPGALAADDGSSASSGDPSRRSGTGENGTAAAGGVAVAQPLAASPAVAVPAVAGQVIPFPAPSTEMNAIIERLRAGKCVLWAGSGLDEQAGGVGFRGIVSRLLDQLPASDETTEARALLPRRPFLVAGFVRRRLGDRFEAALRAASAGPSEVPKELKLLAELPFRAVVTTGFSDIVARAFAGPFARDGKPAPVYTPADAPLIAQEGGRKRYILQALGDPGHEAGMVFSAKDLQAALGSEQLAGVVRDFHKNRTVLFLGLDPAIDIDRLFVRVLQGVQEDGAMHFAVLPGLTRIEREELLATCRIQVIDEEDAFAFIRALRAAVGEHIESLPDDDDVEGWVSLLMNDPDRPDHLRRVAALEQRLVAAGDHERLLELHLGMAEVESAPAGRARRLQEVARLFDQQFGEPAKAFTALLAAYKEDPTRVSAAELERLAEATRSWADLLSEFVAVAASLPQAQRSEHWAHVARLYLDKLGNAESAIKAAEAALQLEPAHAEARAVRIASLRRAEKWPELAGALGEAAAAAGETPARRAELLLEQADLLETRLSDHAAAVRAYHGALAADPTSVDALTALELLHRRRSEWKELVQVLDDKAKVVPPAEAKEVRLEAAATVRDKLHDRDGAIARFEALRGDSGLETLQSLVALYDAAGRTEEYFEALSAQAAATPDAGARNTLYRRLAVEWEERDNGAARAAEFLEKILAIEPKDEDVLRYVERLYGAQRKWEALVDAYKRHLALPAVDRVALLSSIARVFERDLGDAGRAIDAWEKVLGESPDSEDALGSLTRLHEAAKAWDKVLALLDRRFERSRDREGRARALYEAGRIAADHMGDDKLAEERYHRALEVDPTFVPAMTAMVELYRKSGEFLRAAKLLVEAEQHTTNRLEKTRLLVEAGEIYDSLEERGVAIDMLLKALQVDPEHVEAGNRLAELLWTAQRHAELVPVLDMLTRKDADKQTAKVRLLRLGAAARAIGQSEKSARAFLKAAEIDPADPEAQRESGLLLFAEAKWTEAREAFKAVLANSEQLADRDRIDLYFRLGECNRKLGELDLARNFYGKALELDATHRPTILAMIDVEGDDPRKIVDSKRALLATANDDEKVKLLGEIGDSLLGPLGQPAAAIAAYREALAVRPDSRSLLHKALEVHVAQKEWQPALDLLARLTDLEQVPVIRGKLRWTRALIHLDELSDAPAAIQLLGEAYNDDPASARVSQKLEELLVTSGSWKDLQRFYRDVLKNMRPDAEADTAEQRRERLRIWSAIADLSIDKLGELDVGLSALEVAATFDRDNLKRREQLADLYVEGGADYADRAIAAHQQLLKAQHDRVASYRALRQLYGMTHQPEKALAVAYALAFLKKGAPEDAALVAEAKQRPLQPTRRNLDDDLWTRHLAHPDEDKHVDQLFSLLLPTLSQANGQKYEAVGIHRKDAVQATDGRGFAKGLRYVSSALNVTMPFETYVKYEQREAVTVLNCLDAKMAPIACVVVGQPLLGDRRGERELVYEVTKRLAHFRSDRYLRYVLHLAAQLGLVIDAAVALGAEADREKGATGDISKIAQDFKRSLQPKSLEQVQAIGRKLKGSRGADLAGAWLAATELTATRAAFLLVGDLETTARFVAAEPAAVSTHSAVHRLKELIHFSVTEDCFALRKHMGLLS